MKSVKKIHQADHAFSLSELLMVTAIIAVLMALVAPSLTSILGTKGVGKALGDVASLLELARTEAMARRTYVYVGLVNTTNSNGSSELTMAAVASLDGSSDTTTNNLTPITRIVRVPNVAQTSYNDLPQPVKNVASDADEDDAYASRMTSSGVSFDVGNQTFDTSMLIISPEGELLPAANEPVFLELAHVGVVQMRGTQPSDSDGGVVTYEGGSGAIKVLRP